MRMVDWFPASYGPYSLAATGLNKLPGSCYVFSVLLFLFLIPIYVSMYADFGLIDSFDYLISLAPRYPGVPLQIAIVYVPRISKYFKFFWSKFTQTTFILPVQGSKRYVGCATAFTAYTWTPNFAKLSLNLFHILNFFFIVFYDCM